MHSALVLSNLKKCSSQNPMPVSLLAMKTGISAEELGSTIEELYQSRRINKCTVTSAGLTQDVVWPTGVVVTKGLKHFVITPSKEPAEETQEISQQEEQMEKSKTQIILEMIAERGSVPLKELEAAANTTAVKAFVKAHADRGLIAISGLNGSKVYSLAPGVTGEQLLAGVQVKRLDKEKSLDDKLEVIPTPEAPEVQFIPQKPVEKNPFRLAHTSDGTLMLFGLNESAIELDKDQTLKLVKFVTKAFPEIHA